MTAYYVSSDGSGDGSANNVPMNWAHMTDFMSAGGDHTASAGDVFYIKAGTYTLSGTDTWTVDGTVTAPISIIGCDSSWNAVVPVRNATTGLLNTNSTAGTACPYLKYDGAYSLAANGADCIIYTGLSLTSARGAPAFYVGANCAVYGCSSVCTLSNSSSNAYGTGGTGTTFLMCDAACTGANSSGAINMAGAGGRVIGCYCTDAGSGGAGITINTATNCVILNNVIYGATDYGILVVSTSATAHHTIVNNTIYNCGGGISLSDAAYTIMCCIVGNHITDTGLYAINNPNATGSAVLLAFNRTRNNTSGPISWVGDFDALTTFKHVTSVTGDGTDEAQDFANYAAGNLTLNSAAPGKGTSYFPHMDIGALQKAEPTMPALTTILDSQTAIGELAAESGTYHAPSANEVWHSAVFGPASGTSGTKTASSLAVSGGRTGTLQAGDIVDGYIVDAGANQIEGSAAGGASTVIVVED
jgi:hypothetical protein